MVVRRKARALAWRALWMRGLEAQQHRGDAWRKGGEQPLLEKRADSLQFELTDAPSAVETPLK